MDKLGFPIELGAIIVYGHTLGRCGALRIGKVLNIDQGTEVRGGRERPWYRITVRGVDDDWSEEKPKLCAKNGILHYPNRIIVLHEDVGIGFEYWKLLEGVS